MTSSIAQRSKIALTRASFIMGVASRSFSKIIEDTKGTFEKVNDLSIQELQQLHATLLSNVRNLSLLKLQVQAFSPKRPASIDLTVQDFGFEDDEMNEEFESYIFIKRALHKLVTKSTAKIQSNIDTLSNMADKVQTTYETQMQRKIQAAQEEAQQRARELEEGGWVLVD